jgi:hypothetical protein
LLVREQEAVVKDYITRGRVDGSLANASIVATDPLPEPSPGERLSSVDQLYAVALRARPDAAQVKIQLDNAELSLRGTQNGVRPQLDLVATAENRGLAGSAAQPGIDPFLTGGYGVSFRQSCVRGWDVKSFWRECGGPRCAQSAAGGRSRPC